MLVELRQCAFGYDKRPVALVESLHLRAGRCLGVFGPNGSGKTTLVRGITGLLPPLSGTIERREGLRSGYLPQHRAMEMYWPMSGLDAASLAVSARQRFGWLGRNWDRIISAMQMLDVDHLARHSFSKLSGGQQQRLLLAGALADEPELLVLDEPTDGLDVRSRQALLSALRDAAAKGLCTIIISHDVEDLMCLAQEVAWLHPAQEPGEPSQVEVIAPTQMAERVVAVRQSP